jgi:hypothetical protein
MTAIACRMGDNLTRVQHRLRGPTPLALHRVPRVANAPHVMRDHIASDSSGSAQITLRHSFMDHQLPQPANEL